jgi:hypothetical protein
MPLSTEIPAAREGGEVPRGKDEPDCFCNRCMNVGCLLVLDHLGGSHSRNVPGLVKRTTISSTQQPPHGGLTWREGRIHTRGKSGELYGQILGYSPVSMAQGDFEDLPADLAKGIPRYLVPAGADWKACCRSFGPKRGIGGRAPAARPRQGLGAVAGSWHVHRPGRCDR